MIIIGCDYHPGFQQIAFVDTETGDYGEQRLEHSERAEKFYRDLAAQEQQQQLPRERNGALRTARIGAPQKCLTLPTLLETRFINRNRREREGVNRTV